VGAECNSHSKTSNAMELFTSLSNILGLFLRDGCVHVVKKLLLCPKKYQYWLLSQSNFLSFD